MVTQPETIEVLPSGLQTQAISSLKRRLRSKYWRQITVKGGEMVWVQTELLPSDSLGREYYTSKGFRLTPPDGHQFAPDNTAQVEQANAEKDSLLAAQAAEIASLKAQLEAKGTTGGRGNGGKRKTGG